MKQNAKHCKTKNKNSPEGKKDEEKRCALLSDLPIRKALAAAIRTANTRPHFFEKKLAHIVRHAYKAASFDGLMKKSLRQS